MADSSPPINVTLLFRLPPAPDIEGVRDDRFEHGPKDSGVFSNCRMCIHKTS